MRKAVDAKKLLPAEKRHINALADVAAHYTKPRPDCSVSCNPCRNR
jgi:hypothetical protein